MRRRLLASSLLLATAVAPVRAQRPVARPSGARVRQSAGTVLSMGAAPEGEALRHRRRQFAGAGALARAAGDDGTSRGLTVLVLPVAITGGAVAGGLAGYAPSFIVYPPRRAG
jgi:1-acyl-sn-glycerol-3-phosphate acyltransferase